MQRTGLEINTDKTKYLKIAGIDTINSNSFHGAMDCGQKNIYASLLVPAPVQVHTQWPLAPLVTSVS